MKLNLEPFQPASGKFVQMDPVSRARRQALYKRLSAIAREAQP